jgi:hypothetical protein
MLKHLIGAGLLTIVAFLIRFRVLPRTLDIYAHGTYIVIIPPVIAFWLLPGGCSRLVGLCRLEIPSPKPLMSRPYCPLCRFPRYYQAHAG